VSLILEALKKLDREKQAPDRGLLVVGPSAWPSLADGRPGMGAGALAVGVLVLAGMAGVVWLVRSAGPPAGAPAAAVTAPAVAPPTPVQPVPTAPAPVAQSNAARPPAGASPSNVRPAPASRPAKTATAAEPLAGTRPEPGTDAGAQPVEPSARSKEPRPGAAGGYQLQAISAQDGHPIAILNDRLVREGDSFDGVKVLRIGAEEVEIEVAGHRRVVKF